jgi:hypothetical protein
MKADPRYCITAQGEETYILDNTLIRPYNLSILQLVNRKVDLWYNDI